MGVFLGASHAAQLSGAGLQRVQIFETPAITPFKLERPNSRIYGRGMFFRIDHATVRCRSVAEWLESSTCDEKVAGSNPDCPPAEADNLGQVVYTHVPLSPGSIIWYRPMGGDARWLEWRGNRGPGRK